MDQYITNPQNAIISNRVFNNSTGGIIHGFYDTNIKIINCTFKNINYINETILHGGLITNYEADMELVNNTFYNIYMQANRISGAIIYHEVGDLNLTNNKFYNITFNVTGNELENRLAGGIIWNRNATSNISNNIFNLTSYGYLTDGQVIYNNI